VRWSRSSLLVFAAALLASLSIHLPVYEILGVLAHKLDDIDKPSEVSEPVEFEIAQTPDAPDGKASDPAQVRKQPESTPDDKVDKLKAKPEVQRPEKPQVARKPEPVKPKPVEVPVQPAVKPPEPERERIDSKHAVNQKSDDPDVPPPDNPRFIAEENRRVEEETVASVRSMVASEDRSSAHAPKSPDEQQGNSQKEDPAELQRVEGSDRRPPDQEEAREKPKAPSEMGHGRERDKAVAPAPERGGAPERGASSQELAAGSERVGGEETVVINDGSGSIRIRRPKAGHGPGDQGGEPNKGAGNESARATGGRVGKGPNLNLSWSQFESTFGEKELQAQREAYLEQRRTQSRGGQREEQWAKFRASIENFVDKVKPGNQTALNAAADPFAKYLTEMHVNIHREFALRFLRSLPVVGGPMSDPNLVTRLEIIVNNDGSLHQVGIVRTSGFSAFDYGAWLAVQRAAPFPVPPKRILSGDGRVYVRWEFYSNERQCGTFNAEPFILPNPGGDPKPKPGPLHDTGRIPPDGKLGLLSPAVPELDPASGDDAFEVHDAHDLHDDHVHAHPQHEPAAGAML